MVGPLLEGGADPDIADSDNRTALVGTAQSGRAGTVRALLKAGADPDIVGESFSRSFAQGVVNAYYGAERPALIHAIAGGYATTVKVLLEGGADYNPGGNQAALIGATKMGETEIVKLLLEAGADPTAANSSGETALDVAPDEIYGIMRRAERP